MNMEESKHPYIHDIVQSCAGLGNGPFRGGQSGPVQFYDSPVEHRFLIGLDQSGPKFRTVLHFFHQIGLLGICNYY